MVAPPDYPWCYTCVSRGCSSCDMMQSFPDPCTNCKMFFRDTNKKITCKRSGLTTEDWAEKRAIETQKVQQNANPMFQFGQAQQVQIPFPMFSPQLGQAASFFPNMYQPQQWFGSMMCASDKSYPQQQQLPGSFPMSTPQLSAGALGQKPSKSTLRAKRKRAGARRSREEEMAANLADTQQRLDDAERKLAASARERERAREDERRVRRRIDDENKNLNSEEQKDFRKQESIRGFENQPNELRRSTPAQHGPPQHSTPIMGSTSQQNYYPPYGQQAYDGQQNPYQMPQGYGYPPSMQYPAQPPMQGQSGGYQQPPPAGNMHHPMQPPMQYPTQPLMHPPPGGHQQPPPAGDQQRQGYQGVEQREYA
ncbi:hypothetical protein KC356_g2824 [Hortaea werneckii]|nr:hypothetical protein KC356_g2824 [Hortaea werneckii]